MEERGRAIGARPLLAALAAGCGACSAASAPAREPPGLDARPPNPGCVAPARPPAQAALEAQFGGRTFALPVFVAQAPGDGSRSFVVEKGGVVRAVAAGASAATTFIDLTARVSSAANEAGLLGLAFHPRFATNGQVFLSYTGFGGPTDLRSVISRFTSRDGGRTLDPASEQVLLTVDQPFANHNGGMIAFGPDRLLYVGLGDGGSGGDPYGNGQDTGVLLGKILRLDVDGAAPYAIPPDNPFAAGGGRPEIFAWGLRNPWRFSFDRATGLLWVGDVGQDQWEEIDVVRRGDNLGWNLREGAHCYAAATCATAGLTDPVAEYDHSQGNAVTGGTVYRGAALPGLQGRYLYADSGSGRVWSVPASAASPGAPPPVPALLLESGRNLVSFGEDADGELYLADYGGLVHKLVAAPGAGGGPAPLLSQTGCTLPGDATRPAAGLVPFAPAAPFWSDGASKERWLALPDGAQAVPGADGDLLFPPGTVLVKAFTLGGRRIETRLLWRYADGGWGGATYAWNDAGTDAALVTQARDVPVAGQTWTLPGPAQCLACHTAAAGFALGPEAAQLDSSFTYPGGRKANQLATLQHVGLVAAGPVPKVAPIPDPFGAAPLELRARALLHANCAQCHRPGGPAPQGDFRFGTAPSAGYCGKAPQAGDLGVAGAQLLKPGRPDASLVVLRMQSLGPARMPPLASHVVDAAGVALLREWIAGMTACP